MFTMYLILVPIVAVVLILLNYLISSENPYTEKDVPFECGFTSYQPSRSAFSVAFIFVSFFFFPFDFEISSIFPYVVSAYTYGLYCLTILVIFLLSLVIAFV